MTILEPTKTNMLEHIFGVSTFTPPSNIYMGLLEAGAEPFEGYSRQEISFERAFSRPDGVSLILNDGEITFQNDGFSTWYIDGLKLFDASSGGDDLWDDYSSVNYEIDSGESITFAKHSLAVRMGELYPLTETATWSTYLQEKVLDHVLNGQSFTAPDVYVALCKSAPSIFDDGSSLDELSGGAYSRVQVSGWTGPLPIENSNVIDFAQATADWEGITHVALVDASSGGNLLAFDVMDSQGETVSKDDTARFNVSSILVDTDF